MITGIVLEGGGVKGIAEIGVISVLEERGLLLNENKYAGASVGALIQGFRACGANAQWLADKIGALDFRQLNDDSYGVIGDIWRLIWKKGWYKGDRLYELCGELLMDLGVDPNITLRDIKTLHGNSVAFTVTKIFKNAEGVPKLKCVIITDDSHPDYQLRKVIRMSAGFPCYFQTVPFEGVEAADGGILCNYPIGVFDTDGVPNKGIIGVKLLTSAEYVDTDSETGVMPTANIKEFLVTLVDGLYSAAQKKHETEADWNRTIRVNTGCISSMDMTISLEQKKWLYEQGRQAAIDYLKLNYIDSI